MYGRLSNTCMKWCCVFSLQNGILKLDTVAVIMSGPDYAQAYVFGYEMTQPQSDVTILGCPIFKHDSRIMAICMEYVENMVPFVHLCRETCIYTRDAGVQVMKEGKRVTIRKPVYKCDKKNNCQYILNTYSPYTSFMPTND